LLSLDIEVFEVYYLHDGDNLALLLCPSSAGA
jgi:hypothetical protein